MALSSTLDTTTDTDVCPLLSFYLCFCTFSEILQMQFLQWPQGGGGQRTTAGKQEEALKMSQLFKQRLTTITNSNYRTAGKRLEGGEVKVEV